MLPERESDNLAQLGSGCDYCKVTQTNSVAQILALNNYDPRDLKMLPGGFRISSLVLNNLTLSQKTVTIVSKSEPLINRHFIRFC